MEWHRIDDFTPGIHQDVGLRVPPGAARIATQCRASVNGALIPGPKLTSEITYSGLWGKTGSSGTLYPYGDQVFISGLFVNGPVYGGVGNPEDGADRNNAEIWVGFNWREEVTPGSAYVEKVNLSRYFPGWGTPAWVSMYDDSVTSDTTGWSQTNVGPAPFTATATRANRGDVTVIGTPVVAWCFGPSFVPYYFPDETDATNNSAKVELDHPALSVPQPIHIIGHQGRCVLFPLGVYYNGKDAAAANVLYTNSEAFYFTQVNDHTTKEVGIGYYDNIVNVEHNNGYIIGESLTANELLLFKAKGGAVKIVGDLADPYVENLPYVKSPGFSRCRGTRSIVGYIYPADSGGVWLYQGGDTSQNIAPHMDPNFWRPTSTNGYYTADSNCAEWGEMAVVPNGYYFDTETQGWWKLDSNNHWHADSDWTGRWLYTAGQDLTDGATVLYEYDRRTLATSYQWKGHPIAPSIEREIRVREVILVASGSGRVTVTVEARNRQPETYEFLFYDDYPEVRAMRGLFSQEGTHVSVTLDAEGSGTNQAPTIHEVRVGWDESTRV